MLQEQKEQQKNLTSIFNFLQIKTKIKLFKIKIVQKRNKTRPWIYNLKKEYKNVNEEEKIQMKIKNELKFPF